VQNFDQYVAYINNTELEPLPVSVFCDDWDPIGHDVISNMKSAGLIEVRNDYIYLRPDLTKQRNSTIIL
jgi:hypothetical protein